ncbi:MAG: hypothetical protein OXG58_11450 [Gemmatimonadetes bacterium]|nr:hypothetical protein [Gemmatimonadota bacterium]MCY3943859.1 hypothetical protein [Gemmatimonadota bacterium]
MRLADGVSELRRQLKRLAEEADRIPHEHRYSAMTAQEAVATVSRAVVSDSVVADILGLKS